MFGYFAAHDMDVGFGPFENDDGLFEVLITGFPTPESVEGLRKINRKLCWEKQALLRTNGSVVNDIRIEKIEEDEEGAE